MRQVLEQAGKGNHLVRQVLEQAGSTLRDATVQAPRDWRQGSGHLREVGGAVEAANNRVQQVHCRDADQAEPRFSPSLRAQRASQGTYCTPRHNAKRSVFHLVK